MNELRWILLIAGIALIVALYVLGTRGRQRSAAAGVERSTRFEPPRAAPPADAARLEPRMSLDDDDRETVDASFDAPPAEARFDTPLQGAQRREPSLGGTASRASDPRPARTEPIVAAPPSEAREPAEREDERPTAAAARPPQKIVAIRVTAAHPARFDGAQLREVLTAARFTHGRYDIFHRLGSDGRPVMSLASLLEPGTFDPATMADAAYPGVAVFTVMPGPLPAVRAFDELLDTARWLAHRLGGQLQDERGAPLSVQRVFKLREEVLAFERSLGSAGTA
jgi:cell division protein ZipA